MIEATYSYSAPMATYMPVDLNIPAHVVAYVSEGDYTREFIPDVPLVAVVLCTVPGASQTVGKVLASLPPLSHVCYFALHKAVVAYNGVLPPTFFAELLGYVMLEWVEERADTKCQKLEELVRDALDMMSLIDPRKSASSKWIEARDHLIVNARRVLEPNGDEDCHDFTPG